ncbi:helix-turn-helix domain-containing protein [Streptomyces ortus]|uniref:Regulator n=1 Tax=Streptomyces ortus TaxID=2867268 RepID=A0ABT3VDH6_9ACTN|nr:helix-turn-helix domain-containing protein [Streptomyces ortus]MCX4237866.1 regulator [Streptomyces ortus]
MTTANDPHALTPLRRARERFLTGLPLPDDVPADVAAAWRRARFFGVPHDLTDPADPAPPAGSALLTAARPVLERLAPPLSSGQSAVVLTDERLRVLWSGGNSPHDERYPDLSEQQVGHNSAALALRSRSRAEVHGPEHFLDLWQDVSAVSVPVLAPENGRVLGTVTVTSGLCAERSPHPGAALAEATVAAVEAELLTRSRTAERVLLDAYQRAAARPGAAVVALDGRNRLLTEAAAGLLPPSALEALEALEAQERSTTANRPDAQTGQDKPHPPHVPHSPRGPHRSHLSERPDRPAEWREPERAAERGRAPYPLELPDAAGTAWITQVCHGGAVIGVVAVIEPPVGLPARPVGPPRVTLAGHSVPWRHATSRAAELASTREPLLLTGERGTGKTFLARQLLAARGEPAPLVVDAAQRPAADAIHGWAGTSVDGRSGTAAPAPDRPLLLRHAEQLAPVGVAALNSLLDAHRHSHPHPPLLVTYTPGTPPGPCLQRLLDSLAARSVALPALRERPDDIRELLAELTPRPAPGVPPLTWSLDALHALERHTWPGNVTELAQLVRALAERRRTTGPVRRAELPDHVRERPPARPLSPMEHAERTAILEALRSHGGNKARTAAALGIARATLYRKLRAYRS